MDRLVVFAHVIDGVRLEADAAGKSPVGETKIVKGLLGGGGPDLALPPRAVTDARINRPARDRLNGGAQSGHRRHGVLGKKKRGRQVS